jgi:hypothetical protein
MNPLLDAWNAGWYAQASDEDRAGFREWFRGVLRNERVNVCFTKADGTERWMHCTLHPDLIPASELRDDDGSTVRRSEQAQSVWDIEKQAWRSFRWDTIKEFSFNLGELHV